MQLKRTALAAIVIAAVAAPNAPAMPIRERGTVPVVQQEKERGQYSTRFEEMLALRNALRHRQWPQNAPVVALARPAEDGFDWRSALIGAVVPVALLLVVFAGRPVLARRRRRVPALS